MCLQLILFLIFFSNYLGIPDSHLKDHVDYLIDTLDLRNDAYSRASVLSGGTKRKLSLAIALIGSPSVLLLDEPTTGIDPFSKKNIWSVLQNYQKDHFCSIVLSSHSMEECEVLSSRIGIMIKGEFKCLGEFYLDNLCDFCLITFIFIYDQDHFNIYETNTLKDITSS